MIPESFFERLQHIYQEDANLQSSWQIEGHALRDILPQVDEELPSQYEIVEPLGVGGSGVVTVVNDNNLGVKRALKLSRPSPGKEDLLARILFSETEALLRLSHQNLIRIFAQGVVTREDRDHPWYVMEYVEGVKDLDDFLELPNRTQDQFLTIFTGVLSAVEYLHSQEQVHMDLKPGNVLVTPSCVPIVSDLGFAKQLRIDGQYTLIGGTVGYIHPEARALVEEAKSDPNRLRGEAPRSSLKPAWDLYSLGKTFLNLLHVLEEHNPKTLSPYAKRYLRLLACRLLDGLNSEEERAVGLSLSTLKEIKYTNATQARIDLEKLTGSYNLESRIPELNTYGQDTIQVTTLSTTPFTARIKSILSHPAVMRLGSITQLGLLNLVYPTATHTRLEHSIGTLSVLSRYIVALYNDPLNPLFKQIMGEEDLKASLLSALLHDIGQYPLAHDLEEADEYGFKHEQLTTKVLKDKTLGLGALVEKNWGVSIERILGILDANPSTISGTLKDRILHSLIDGPIDADKLDYLMRDSLRLGLNYGNVIDLEYLLRSLTIIFRQEDGDTYAALGIHEKGKVPAEAIAFARYAMFGAVYWHHTYRAIKIMIHWAVWDALSRCKDDRERTKLRKEFQGFVLPMEADQPAEQLELTANERRVISPLAEVRQIQESDLAVVRWLGVMGGPSSKEFVRLLEERRLFKRVLVLSREKAPDKTLWDDLAEFQRANGRNWRKRLRLQEAFQQRIVLQVENTTHGAIQSAIITDDARNKFIVDGRGKQILLVDIPPGRRSTNTRLEYLIEEDRRWFKADELRTASLEQSLVWQQLQSNFLESIGKVRVFCHPDHADFLSAFLSRTAIEQALGGARREVEAASD